MGITTYLDVGMYLPCCGGKNADCRTDWLKKKRKKNVVEKTVIAFLEVLCSIDDACLKLIYI